MKFARKVVVSTSSGKCGLQYKINATYASVIVTAVTFCGGKDRSGGVNEPGPGDVRAGVLLFGRGEVLLGGCIERCGSADS